MAAQLRPRLAVKRVGYSALEARAWIRPHTGVDNQFLKLHLGLVWLARQYVLVQASASHSALRGNSNSGRR